MKNGRQDRIAETLTPILDFCRWMEEHPETGNPFKGAGMSTLTARMNYSSSYTDIMLYKEMTEAA